MASGVQPNRQQNAGCDACPYREAHRDSRVDVEDPPAALGVADDDRVHDALADPGRVADAIAVVGPVRVAALLTEDAPCGVHGLQPFQGSLQGGQERLERAAHAREQRVASERWKFSRQKQRFHRRFGVVAAVGVRAPARSTPVMTAPSAEEKGVTRMLLSAMNGSRRNVSRDLASAHAGALQAS